MQDDTAAYRSSYDCDASVIVLLFMKLKTDLENDMGETPLTVGVKHRQLRAVSLLRTCPVNIPDYFGQLPLLYPAVIGNLPPVHRLVNAFPQALATVNINDTTPPTAPSTRTTATFSRSSTPTRAVPSSATRFG